MAKQFTYTDDKGTTHTTSYWNVKYYPINLRTGQESIVFWVDGFSSETARLNRKSFVNSVSLEIPKEYIAKYISLHLINKKTLPELAYIALAEFGINNSNPILAQLALGQNKLDASMV